MREILFKAKRLDNGKWIQGYYQKRFDVDGSEQHFIFGSKSYTVWEYAEIDPDTLCQYTGLTDKNDKKIWENDICNRKEKYYEIVTYNEGDWQLDYSYVFKKELHYSACNLGFYACERKCVEVIGNVFDNPELLEV